MRKLNLEGYNYTKGEPVSADVSQLDYFWKNEGLNQEITFDLLEVTKRGEGITFDLSNWPSSFRNQLFDLCSTLPFQNLKILKEYRSQGYSPDVVFEIMEDDYYYIVQFDQGLRGMNAGDVLFEYLEETGYFNGIPEEIKNYFCKERKLIDWEIENHPVIEIAPNTFAILFRR